MVKIFGLLYITGNRSCSLGATFLKSKDIGVFFKNIIQQHMKQAVSRKSDFIMCLRRNIGCFQEPVYLFADLMEFN
jgi:hypothetical protein